MATERLEMEIVGKNSTGKGWDKVESEAKARAKKIRDAIARDGGLVGSVGGHGRNGKGGLFSSIREGFGIGKNQGIGGLMPGGGAGGMGPVAIGAGVVGLIAAAVAKLASIANEYADTMSKMADNSGISIAAAQNLVYSGKAYGVGADQIETALGKIANAQSKAGRDEGVQKSLERLNIPLKEFMTMSPDQAYSRLGKALKETGDRASVMEIVGKSGMKQIAFMKEIAGGIGDIGLASEQNVQAVDSFFDKISQGVMRAKAGIANKAGQLIRGDLMGFFTGREAEKKQTPVEQIESQNEKIKKEKEADEAIKMANERKSLKAQIEEKKDTADQAEDEIREKQDRLDATEKELNEKKARGHFERNARSWSGLQDMTAEQEAADDLKRGFNRGYDRQQAKAERDARRMERRMQLREDMLQNKNLRGPWVDKMRKVFDKAHQMAEKRDFVEDYNKVIAKMSKEQRDLLVQIQKDTKALQKLDKAFTMGGAQEAEGG